MPDNALALPENVDKVDEGLLAGGLALVGTGVALGAVMVAQKRRGWFVWAIPGALLAAGLALMATSGGRQYSSHVDRAEQAMREQLDALDPFARIKVLKDLAQEQIPSWAARGSQPAE